MAKERIQRFITLTAEKRVCMDGRDKWVEIGDEITVPKWMAGCFLLDGTPAKDIECYPSACSNEYGASTVDMYRDLIVLPAGTPVTVAVPNVEGCGSPAMVQFVPCGLECIFVEYNGPIALPTANIEGGISPDMNPIKRQLCESGEEPITEISIVSPDAGFVQLIYTGQCQDC